MLDSRSQRQALHCLVHVYPHRQLGSVAWPRLRNEHRVARHLHHHVCINQVCIHVHSRQREPKRCDLATPELEHAGRDEVDGLAVSLAADVLGSHAQLEVSLRRQTARCGDTCPCPLFEQSVKRASVRADVCVRDHRKLLAGSVLVAC